MSSNEEQVPPDVEWSSPLKVAVIQNELHLGDLERSLSETCFLIDAACRKEDPDLLVLPEMFATGFPYDKLAELSRRSDEIVKILGEKAREYGTGVIFTSSVIENGVFLNRLFLLDRHGSPAGHYDKTHLFSRSGEDGFFKAGRSLKLFSCGDVNIGPLICYEVRFPELSRKLVFEGASILVYPAQWPLHRIFQWELLLKARALENQCFVIGANIHGDHEGTMMGGHSMIVSPYGKKMAEVGSGSGFAAAKLDASSIRRFRKGIPVLGDLRRDMAVERVVTSPL